MGSRVLRSIKAGACFVFRKTVRQRVAGHSVVPFRCPSWCAGALGNSRTLCSGLPRVLLLRGLAPFLEACVPFGSKGSIAALLFAVSRCSAEAFARRASPHSFWFLSNTRLCPFHPLAHFAVPLPVAPRACRTPRVMKALISPLLFFAAGVSSLAFVSLFVLRVPPVFLFLGRCAEPSPALKTSRPGAVLIFAKSVPAPKNVAFERPEKVTGQPCPMDFTHTLSRPCLCEPAAPKDGVFERKARHFRIRTKFGEEHVGSTCGERRLSIGRCVNRAFGRLVPTLPLPRALLTGFLAETGLGRWMRGGGVRKARRKAPSRFPISLAAVFQILSFSGIFRLFSIIFIFCDV
ncbi:hypothetical protein ERJ75_000994100 [Trypanosoma vivax]|nr:hypothetical protein ERJ75_000994100 [Trypanosoma vivax]